MKLRSLLSLVTEQSAQKVKPSGYYGELCPICRKTKMSSYSAGPICEHCRGKFGLTEDDLKPFEGRRILFNQRTIDWKAKPNPLITGTIDDQPWQASFINEKWHTHSLEEPPNPQDATLITNFLTEMTPVWKEIAKRKKTSIRRYRFIAAVGVIYVTGRYLLKIGSPKESEEE